MAETQHGDNLLPTLLGPLAWGGHFVFVYAVVSLICDGLLGDVLGRALLFIATGAALLFVGYLVHRFWRRLRGPRGAARRGFGAKAGLLLSILSLIAILWTALPMLLIIPCHETVGGARSGSPALPE